MLSVADFNLLVSQISFFKIVNSYYLTIFVRKIGCDTIICLLLPSVKINTDQVFCTSYSYFLILVLQIYLEEICCVGFISSATVFHIL